MYTVSQKNEQILATIFVKHGLILVMFGKQHQHTFNKNLQLSYRKQIARQQRTQYVEDIYTVSQTRT